MRLNWPKARLKLLSVLAIVTIVFNALAAPAAISAARTITPQNLLELHNSQRRAAGLPPLKMNNTLAVSAQRKAQIMLETNCWSHYCPVGKEPWDFFKESGYSYRIAGENLAEGFFSAESVITAWMNSPSHKENIMRDGYEEVGFGIIQGDFQGRNNNIIIAVHFAAPLTPKVEGVTNGNELISPQILSPQEGQAFNTNNILVSGTAPEATEVKLFNRGEPLATIDANEGSFTTNQYFGEGNYTLSAQSRVGERSATSEAVRFSVDQTGDPISSSSIVFNNVDSLQSNLLINQPNLHLVQIVVAGTTYTLTTNDINTWQASIPNELIMRGESIKVTTEDEAGNTWSGEISGLEVKAKLNNALIRSNTEDSGRVISAELKLQGNIFFIGSMLVFFLIDYFRLRDTGLTRKRGHVHLHIGIIAIAVIILLAGTFSAAILNGIKLF